MSLSSFRSLSFSIVVVLLSASASASPIMLDDWAFNIDGAVSEYTAGDQLPGSGSLDDETGLGALTFDFSSPGTHSLFAFFDFELAQAGNTYFNEYGGAVGNPGVGQSWQIDEPGYIFGTIYDNLIAGSLDSANYIPESMPDDVSFALGWEFTLLENETAQLSLSTSNLVPTEGFYLSQTDPELGASFDRSASVYFSGDLSITSAPVDPVSVPEPASAVLLLIGLVGLSFRRFYQ